MSADEVIEAHPRTSAMQPRRVLKRTAGKRHGAITRLVSPGDLGRSIKPFVFLDEYAFPARASTLFGMHPHSGIATLTLALQGSVWINDTLGTAAWLREGDLEWMRASAGAWHESAGQDDAAISGLQLWLALPPHLENAVPESAHIPAQAIPRVGPADVLMGEYLNVRGPVPYSQDVNYLNVRLTDAESWTYTPPGGHSVAWVFVYQGRLLASGERIARQLAVFQKGEQAIHFEAEGQTAFVIGSARPHAHELILGTYSVHTSPATLMQGLAEIDRIGASLNARRSVRPRNA